MFSLICVKFHNDRLRNDRTYKFILCYKKCSNLHWYFGIELTVFFHFYC